MKRYLILVEVNAASRDSVNEVARDVMKHISDVWSLPVVYLATDVVETQVIKRGEAKPRAD